MAIINTTLILLFLHLIVHSSVSIFVEQDGEYNWRRSFIGVVDGLDRLKGPISDYIVSTFGSTILSRIKHSDGSVLWRSVLPKDQVGYSHVVVGSRIVQIVGSSRTCSIYTWSLDGSVLWESDVSKEYCNNNVETTVLADEAVAVLVPSQLLLLSNLQSTATITEWKASQYLDSGISKRFELSHLIYPSRTAMESTSRVATGCVVDDHGMCERTAVLTWNPATRLIAVSLFKGLSGPPSAIHSFIAATGDYSHVDIVSVVHRIPTGSISVQVLSLSDDKRREASVSLSPSMIDIDNPKISLHSIQKNDKNIVMEADICSASECDVYLVSGSVEGDLSLDKVVNVQSAHLPIARVRDLDSESLAFCQNIENSIVCDFLSLQTMEVSKRLFPARKSSSSLLFGKLDSKSGRMVVQTSDGYFQQFSLTSKDDTAVVSWQRAEAVSYIRQILLVNDVDKSLRDDTQSNKESASLIPSFRHRILLQVKEIESFLSSVSVQGVVDACVSVVAKFIPMIKSTESRKPNSRMLALHLNSNKIGVALSFVPMGKAVSVVVSGIDGSTGAVIWTSAFGSIVSNNVNDFPKLLLHRRATAALSAELFLVVSSGAVYRIDSSSGSYSELSMQADDDKLISVFSLPSRAGTHHDLSYFTIARTNAGDIRIKNLSETSADLSAIPRQYQKLYFHTIDKHVGRLECYSHDVVTKETSPVSIVSFPEYEKIVGVFHANNDQLHSRFTVLGDDSILLQYLNPFLLAIVTVNPPEAASDYYHPAMNSNAANEDLSLQSSGILTISFIDGISGRILHRISHINGAAPVNGIFLDSSSFVLSYWNYNAKRTELSSISLYDGLVDRNSLHPFATSGTSTIMQQLERSSNFSSFVASSPLAMQRTYWLPKWSITSMQTTTTTASITNKNVLLTTTNGQLLSLDLRHISPRRPLTAATKAEAEEGLMQYHPLLLLQPTNAVLSIDQGMVHRGPAVVSTAPTALESTVAVLSAWGPDLYFNVVKPSQSFDSLASDFNYSLLAGILALLAAAVGILRRQVMKKRLGLAWS